MAAFPLLVQRSVPADSCSLGCCQQQQHYTSSIAPPPIGSCSKHRIFFCHINKPRQGHISKNSAVVVRNTGPGEFNRFKPSQSRQRNFPRQISPPGLGQFKPPPLSGYGAAPPPERDIIDKEGHESLLEQVRDRCGTWQERAKALLELQKDGFTSEELYERAFISTGMQTAMVVAAQVFDSLVSTETPSEVLTGFDESKIDVLYALRTLSARQRRAAAEYVGQENLDVSRTQELVRAMKEYERRSREREGFTARPGDCLALMLYRAAMESRESEQRILLATRGLQVAISDSAKQQLCGLLEDG